MIKNKYLRDFGFEKGDTTYEVDISFYIFISYSFSSDIQKLQEF
ncbi:putative exported domain protein [Clostridioides difficile DA00129]|nr:putative exported domain protein [Clostridioides difficile CD46]EQG38471.1 putative exported domain protein [Clostridioides difficile DA00129]EQH67656.1 putative exported domain protein [Clostridioides difficile DA00273]EQK16104.1 putative exported domain protein [Clostridioides difficile P69]